MKIIRLIIYLKILSIETFDGGETGIRTQERVAPLPVFKTGAFNRSAISPYERFYKYNFKYQLKTIVYFKNTTFPYCLDMWLREVLSDSFIV